MKSIAIRVITLFTFLLFGATSIVATPIPDEAFECTGDLFGLIDETGREVIKPKYARIEYERNGLFVVTEVNAKNKYHLGKSKRLFNYEGEQIEFSLPSGAEFIQLAYVGDEADRNHKLNVMSIPVDSLIVFRLEKKYGLCFPSGKTVSPQDLIEERRKRYFDVNGNVLRTWHYKDYFHLGRILNEFKPTRKISVTRAEPDFSEPKN